MKIIINTIKSLIDRASKNRAAKNLLLLTDRQLADIGISRAQLMKGASAYPWYVGPHLTVVSSSKRVTPKVTSQFEQRELAA